MQIKNRIDSFRCIHAYDRLVNATQVAQECCDNSLQYGTTQLGAIVDSKNNRLVMIDNGDGMDLNTFLGSYHEIHGAPGNTNGISTFGVGSKIFVKLSNTRITLTRDKAAGEMYYSVWDV